MTSTTKNWLVLLGVGLPATAISLLILNEIGHSDDSVRVVLRLTARAAFLVWLVVFVTRPLHQMFGTPGTRWLMRERRSFGLAFASIFVLHLSYILYRTQFVDFDVISFPGSLPGMIAYTLLLGMIVTSFDGPRRAIGPRRWRILHKAGLYWIGLLFFVTLLPRRPEQFFEPTHLWFTMLMAIALVIRLTAYLASRKRS